MRVQIAVALSLALSAGVAAGPAAASHATAGQKPSTKDESRSGKKPKSITIVGCVSQDEHAPDHLTIADDKDGTLYRVSGKNLREYVGRRVELVGALRHPVHVKFGLFPSPNVAAQAGAMDPTQAATASAPGGAASGTGNVALPELRVTKVSAGRGECQ
jgi:hypothetical protein